MLFKWYGHLLFISVPPLLNAGYSTGVNLAAVVIDCYQCSDPGTQGQIWNCSGTQTFQQCMHTVISNYVSQGVTDVRFFFTLQRANISTVWDTNHQVRTQWRQNLQTFLTDLKNWGITSVSPTPVMQEPWTSDKPPNSSAVMDCTGVTTLDFFPWLPYGIRHDNGYVDCQDINDAWRRWAAHNTVNWQGWQPYFNMMSAVFSATAAAGLQIKELDLFNEMELVDFTAQARFIYDYNYSTMTGTDVLGTLRSKMSANGFDPLRLTYSTPAVDTTVPQFDCASLWGDSAYFITQDALSGAIAGSNGLFGLPSSVSYTNGLTCGGGTSGMTYLLKNYTQPTTFDIHVYPCIINSNGYCASTDATATARQFYTDVWGFMSNHGLTSSYAVFGETTTTNNTCTGAYWPSGSGMATASQNVNGYKSSSLYSHAAGQVLFRPFDNISNRCMITPRSINPPYAF